MIATRWSSTLGRWSRGCVLHTCRGLHVARDARPGCFCTVSDHHWVVDDRHPVVTSSCSTHQLVLTQGQRLSTTAFPLTRRGSTGLAITTWRSLLSRVWTHGCAPLINLCPQIAGDAPRRRFCASGDDNQVVVITRHVVTWMCSTHVLVSNQS